jgi:DNA invertase Pin-like site-specific DNA recombinase
MMRSTVPEKIDARHRERGAVVYVRQSTPRQLHHNRESQRNQYALVQRALELGWVPERVRVIDADLGQSGQDGQREGFRDLVAAVSLGQVGLILAYEASRLARSNADWYALLDLAALVGALIGDADGIYDPRAYNDRLLLGLRGMLSEAELHLLRLRLDAGRQRQIERGEYRQPLPTGLVRLPDGRVVKDPDQQVQAMLALVFDRFAVLGSCQKVLRRLHADGLLLPRRQTSGPDLGRLLWRKPSDGMVYAILRNPAYAGAFVHGRRRVRAPQRTGQPRRLESVPLDEWPAVHQDAYAAYITWDVFVANQQRMADNASRFAQRARGAVRAGEALLVGLVVCGRCGRQMRVAYQPHIRYFCSALSQAHAENTCLSLDGPSVERAVVATFFEALQPAELDLLDDVLTEQRADRARVVQQYADRVERAAYEVRLARRQYDAVDPDNRLVAGELEHRWELALRAEVEAQAAAAHVAATPAEPELDPTLRAQLRDAGRRLPGLWASGRVTAAQKKELLRALIRRVILARSRPDKIEVKVVWISGAFSVLEAHPPIHRAVDVAGYDQLVERTLALGAEGVPDGEIARRLTADGFRSARHPTSVPARLVGQVRRRHGQTSLLIQLRGQDQVDRQWTVAGLARALGVARHWVYRRIRQGVLPTVRHAATGYHLIPDDPALLASLRAEVAAVPPAASRPHHRQAAP